MFQYIYINKDTFIQKMVSLYVTTAPKKKKKKKKTYEYTNYM